MSRRRESTSKRPRAPQRTGVKRLSGNWGYAPVFAALGDETRLRLVAVLCGGAPISITRLTAGIGVTRQAVTKHLHVLADAGLVRDVKVGRERLWQFEPDQLHKARQALDAIAGQWEIALASLKRMVEE